MNEGLCPTVCARYPILYWPKSEIGSLPVPTIFSVPAIESKLRRLRGRQPTEHIAPQNDVHLPLEFFPRRGLPHRPQPRAVESLGSGRQTMSRFQVRKEESP